MNQPMFNAHFVNKSLVSKITNALPIVTFLAVSSALTTTAAAELIINTSINEAGQTTMQVRDDVQQDGLPPAQLGISPARIDEVVSLSRGNNTSALNQSITLYNYSNRPKDVILNLVDIDALGSAIAPSDATLKPWTLINPTQFTIPAQGQQTIRLSIRPPLSFATGAHHAMLTIEQQIDNAITYDADGKGVTVEIGSRYGLPVHIEFK